MASVLPSSSPGCVDSSCIFWRALAPALPTSAASVFAFSSACCAARSAARRVRTACCTSAKGAVIAARFSCTWMRW